MYNQISFTSNVTKVTPFMTLFTFKVLLFLHEEIIIIFSSDLTLSCIMRTNKMSDSKSIT